MPAPTDSGSGGTPRGEGRAPLRLADANHTPEVSNGDSVLAQMISALRARVDEEFRIMERLDAKARQAFALVAALFAVVQAVAFGAFSQSGVDGTALAILAGLAIFAGLSVGVVGHHLRNEEELQREKDLDPDVIRGWWDAGENVSLNLASGLTEVANRRYANNLQRAELYKKLDRAARISLILTSAELIWAIAIRGLF